MHNKLNSWFAIFGRSMDLAQILYACRKPKFI